MPRRLPLVNNLARRVGAGVALILLSNVAIFLVAFVGFHVLRSKAFAHIFYDWLALSLANVAHGRVWTLLTYGWLHDVDDLFHIVGNMLVLYFLAPPLERAWGMRRMLRFWFGAVLGGGLLSLVAALLGTDVLTLGASAGSVALIGAWSWRFPNQRLLLFFVVPIQARWLVYGVVAGDILLAVTGSDVAIWAHFGGLIAAWLMVNGWTRPQRLRLLWRKWRLQRDAGHRKRVRDSLKVLRGGRDKKDDDDEPMIH